LASLRPRNRRGRLILLYFVIATVVSVIGTFLAVYTLRPSEFWTMVIAIGLPIAVTGSMVTHLTMALDDIVEE